MPKKRPTTAPTRTTATATITTPTPGRATVVNIRNGPCSVYGGRANGGQSSIANTEPGQAGWLGNPYQLHHYTSLAGSPEAARITAIRLYRTFFENKLLRDPAFASWIDSLRDACRRGQNITLGCHCHPLPCHLDLVAAHINGDPPPAYLTTPPISPENRKRRRQGRETQAGGQAETDG